MKTIQEIAKKIETILQDVSRTEYFTVYGVDGRQIKIRVGNHSGNKRNNGDTKTLSFISNRTTQRQSAYNSMIEEWEVSLENMLTDTYQTIEQVLEWEDVAEDQEAAEELYYELD
jgi:hypothetical protein